MIRYGSHSSQHRDSDDTVTGIATATATARHCGCDCDCLCVCYRAVWPVSGQNCQTEANANGNVNERTTSTVQPAQHNYMLTSHANKYQTKVTPIGIGKFHNKQAIKQYGTCNIFVFGVIRTVTLCPLGHKTSTFDAISCLCCSAVRIKPEIGATLKRGPQLCGPHCGPYFRH